MTQRLIHFGSHAVALFRYAARANAILGTRGSGKTYTSTYMAESLMDAGIPVFIVDSSNMWKNLKVPNGTDQGKGYDLVVVGGTGDIIIDESFDVTSIVGIVESALNNHVSLIFDTYRPKVDRATWGEILTLAFQTLYEKNEGLAHIFIEEAATIMPQSKKAYSRSLYEVLEEITRVGGNCQLGITFVNQRAEQLNKEVLELCDMIVLHRQRGKNTLNAIRRWLGMGVIDEDKIKVVLDSVPTLKNGEGWILEKESTVARLVQTPVKKSLHPDRERVEDDYLGQNPNVESFMGELKTAVKVYDPSDFEGVDLLNYTANRLTEDARSLRQTIVLDMDSLSKLDVRVVDLAARTSYGSSSTVRKYIDACISERGYSKFEYMGANLPVLRAEDGSYIILHSKIEELYAQIAARSFQNA